jgi:filamentous hemagglutinin
MRCLLKNIYCFIWWGQVWANGIVFTHIEPQVYTAANGTEVINIAPLKGNRTSFNEYSHFNVSEKGLVFVNSRKAVWSQQAGMLAGNPNLSFEVASLIINEVTSPNATQLLGMLEVAGAPASLVVANPWGITCNNCGFINTPHVMLANAGVYTDNLKAIASYIHKVRTDVSYITIEGKPIKGNLDYLTILTHKLTLNTEIHAKHLQIILGKNRLAGDRREKPEEFTIFEKRPGPQSVLDVSSIGGMYANKIIIINTAQQGSINYRGTLQASGPVVIDSIGEVLLQGKIEAQALRLKTPQLYLDKASTINTSYLAIDAPIVKISGSQIKASHLTMTGHIIENRDSNIEADHLSMSGTNIENINSNIKADHLTMLASQQIDITGQVQTGKFAQIKTDRLTLNGTIRGTEKLEVQVYEGYDNSQKLISAPQLLLHTGDAYYRAERESTERYRLYKQQHGL